MSPLRKLFGGRDDGADDAPQEVLIESRYCRADGFDGHARAAVLVEKFGEREAHVVFEELSTAAAQRGGRMTLDMTHVTLLASAGIGCLTRLHRSCDEAGGKLAVWGVEENILGMLKLSRMDRLLTLKDDQVAAVRAVGK